MVIIHSCKAREGPVNVAIHQLFWAKALLAMTIVLASRDTTIRIWNVETGDCEAVLEGHNATIRSLATHGDTLASASYDHDATIWSLEKRKCLHLLKGHKAQIYTVAF
jgi:F-box and WD-40 domain protein CDC4